MIEENDNDTKVGIRDFPTHNINPYMAGDQFITDDKSVGVSIVGESNKINQSVTHYHTIDKIGLREILCDTLRDKLQISKSGIIIFGYLYEKLKSETSKKDIDEKLSEPWELDFDDCKEKTGYTSAQSLFNGVSELLEKNIIARSGNRGFYFLNHNFFKPSNTLIITEYYKIGS